MTVIENGRKNLKKTRITCPCCTSVLEYDDLDIYDLSGYSLPEDYVLKDNTNYSHGEYYSIEYIECPICHIKFEV